jgi:glycosyltransferase involved in cell wall biosynthesis
MASGRPVIAFDKSGVRDSVVDGVSGILFQPQTVDGLIAAVRRFEEMEGAFDPVKIAAHAAQFDRVHFRARFLEALRGFGVKV